jgi:hypothetical protein
MVLASEYLIDTNILLRLSRQSDPQRHVVQTALEVLNRQGVELYFSACLAEIVGGFRFRKPSKRVI